MEGSLPNHMNRIKDKLKKSLETIREVRDGRTVVPYDVPGVPVNRDVLDVSPPLEHDKCVLLRS